MSSSILSIQVAPGPGGPVQMSHRSSGVNSGRVAPCHERWKLSLMRLSESFSCTFDRDHLLCHFTWGCMHALQANPHMSSWHAWLHDTHSQCYTWLMNMKDMFQSLHGLLVHFNFSISILWTKLSKLRFCQVSLDILIFPEFARLSLENRTFSGIFQELAWTSKLCTDTNLRADGTTDVK